VQFVLQTPDPFMHVVAAAKLLFHEQTAACPVVAGDVATQALYCPLVTSVASIQ
jgi:hypothetical protein